MRRAVLIGCCAALALGGCASSDDEPAPAAPPELASVQFPQRPFIAQVDAPPQAVEQATRKARKAKPEQPAARGSEIAPGAPSDDEIRAELAELYGDDTDVVTTRAVLLRSGEATAPPDAPREVQAIVDAANKVARLPYVYGGGHGGGEGLFIDSAYDCSGSISFALANAGLIDRPMTSGELANWGEPGQGKWVTIYANAEHAFMVVGGARFDTVGLRQTGSRWQRPFRTVRGFTAVHPPGL